MQYIGRCLMWNHHTSVAICIDNKCKYQLLCDICLQEHDQQHNIIDMPQFYNHIQNIELAEIQYQLHVDITINQIKQIKQQLIQLLDNYEHQLLRMSNPWSVNPQNYLSDIVRLIKHPPNQNNDQVIQNVNKIIEVIQLDINSMKQVTRIPNWNQLPQQVFTKHTNTIHQLAISPTSTMIASASADRTIRLYHPNGTLITTLNGHKGYVYTVQFSNNQKWIASAGSDKTILIWNLSNLFEQPKQLYGHTDTIKSIVFSKCSDYIVSGSFDATVRIWNICKLKEIRCLIGHCTNVMCVTTINNYIASAGDNNVKLWEFNTGRLLRTYRFIWDAVWSVQFNNQCNQLVISGFPNSKILLLDIRNGRIIKQFPSAQGQSWTARFSGDQQYIGCASTDKSIKIWDINTSTLVYRYTSSKSWIRCICFADDCSYFVNEEDKCLIIHQIEY